MIENVLAKDINGLEPRLTPQGYNAKVLAELLNAKPREIKSFLSGQLASGRTQELQSEIARGGNPALRRGRFLNAPDLAKKVSFFHDI
jgi:hypothetical protein